MGEFMRFYDKTILLFHRGVVVFTTLVIPTKTVNNLFIVLVGMRLGEP